MNLRIGQLAQLTGVTVETIRFYENKGLLPEPTRLSNNYRVYGATHVQRLSFIRNCRSLDIGLDDIAALLNYDTTDPEQAQRLHGFVHEHIDKVSRRIAELESLREMLRSLETHCHGHGAGRPCGIMQSLTARRPINAASEGH